MNDNDATIAQLKKIIDDFVSERNWHRYHDAKNLSTSIAIEAAELMEHFQWVRNEEVEAIKTDVEQMAEIREEVADVLAYLLSFATAMEIDLSSALEQKMAKNDKRYPVEEFYGTFKKRRGQ